MGKLVVSLLKAYGVQTVFGMPGVHNLELYRGLNEAGMRHVLVRHEQGAGFMADGFARASGKPGVAVTISGPGLTNIATPLAQAWSDSVSVLCLSSTLGRSHLGLERGKVHELADQAQTVSQFTSQTGTALSSAQAIEMVHRAFCGFATERPRPAHISLPQDVLTEAATTTIAPLRFPARPVPPQADLEKAARLIMSAERPILICGGGTSEAGQSVRMVAERCDAAVVTTIAGKGVLSDRHPLALGSTLQRDEVQHFIRKADLVFAIGTELAEPDLYITADAEAESGHVAEQPEHLDIPGDVIRLDIDPLMTVRDYPPVLALWGDADATLKSLLSILEQQSPKPEHRAEVKALKTAALITRSDREAAHFEVLKALRTALPDDAIVAADMTQLGYTGCVLFESFGPRSWLFPNGFGTLGYAVPAAIGAKIALPKRAVAAIVGDGGFMFTLAELATAVEQSLGIPILIWDNQCLAEIRDGMVVREIAPIAVNPQPPNFKAIAAGFACGYAAPTSATALKDAVCEALQANYPTIIHLTEAQVETWART